MEHRRDYRRILVTALRAIGVRVLVWGGLVLVVAFLLGYIRLPVFETTSEPSVPATAERDVAPGSGWPHLRGPKYDSTCDETDLVETWPDEGPLVLWVKEIGQGYSGFSAVGGRRSCLDAEADALCTNGRVPRWRHGPCGLGAPVRLALSGRRHVSRPSCDANLARR